MEAKGLEPKSLASRPEVPSFLVEYFEAFWRLSSRRSVGFASENPISTQDILAYIQLYPTDDVDLFMHLIGEMDAEYLTRRYGDKSNKEVKNDGRIQQTKR